MLFRISGGGCSSYLAADQVVDSNTTGLTQPSCFPIASVNFKITDFFCFVFVPVCLWTKWWEGTEFRLKEGLFPDVVGLPTHVPLSNHFLVLHFCSSCMITNHLIQFSVPFLGFVPSGVNVGFSLAVSVPLYAWAEAKFPQMA